MKKQGTTLIELIISMAIFLVIVNICVGAFIATLNLKNMTTNERESQQKFKIATEMVEKMGRQAVKVVLPNPYTNFVNGSDRAQMYFKTNKPAPEPAYTAVQFKVLSNLGQGPVREPGEETTPSGFYYYECRPGSLDETNLTCSNWGTGVDLLGGTVVFSCIYPEVSDMCPNPVHPWGVAFLLLDYKTPVLSLDLGGRKTSSTNVFFSDPRVYLETYTKLENLE